MNPLYANAVQDAAADYARRGWSVIRLKGKIPAEPWAEYQQHRMTLEEIEEKPWPGVGIVTGIISNVVVLDADSPEALEELTRRGHPATPMAKTARGVHAYFQHPGSELPTRIGLGSGLDLKGDGGYVAAPPSKHPSGTAYEWIISPEDEELAPLPVWVIDEVRARGRRAAEEVGETIANGSRNKTLFSIAGTLRRRGCDAPAIAAALHGINAVKCETPLDEDEVRRIAHSAARYHPAESLQRDLDHHDHKADEDIAASNPLLAGRVDMGKAISQGIDPPDELEPDVLLDGKIHHLFGPSESGKTIIGLWLVKRRVEARQYVVVFDAENGPRTIAERLKQMGADPELIGEYLVYLPFPDLTLGERQRQAFYDLLDDIEPVMILFDSWASFLSAAGFSENENAEIEHWDNALTKRAKQRGIASVILDHVPHDADRSRGGARKKEVADVQWRVKKTLDFNRDSVGEVLLVNHKDREGWLPPSVTFSVGGRFGELVCARSVGTVEELGGSDGLTHTERTVLDTLCEEFALTGARMAEWQRATDARDVSRASHYRAAKKLVSREVSSSHRVRLVNETYFPPEDKEPPTHDETSKTSRDKPDSLESQEVSNRSHETNETTAARASLTGLSPLKGETMRPAADTAAPKGGVTPEQQQRIRKLVREGMSKTLACAEVLGKGWVEP